MTRFWVGAFILGIVFVASAARSDTDYICLKACVNNGGGHTSCLPKCSYEPVQSHVTAHPSMDYGCLKSCVDSGGASAACVPQCTSATSQDAPSTGTWHANTPNHNVFTPLLPYNGFMATPHSRQEQAPINAGDCMRLCTQGGLQYQLCNQRCGK
jgi:hypothetical protein